MPAATSFRTAQANFVWEQYWKVVNDKDSQKGTVYYRRSGKEIQMMAEITDPPKSVLFADGKVQVYEPKLKRVTAYEAGKNREAVESFLVLGFGGSGHDMLKSFDVKYLGTENVDGVNAAKLELIPQVRPRAQHLREDLAVDRSGARHLGAAAVLRTIRATTGWPSTPTSS